MIATSELVDRAVVAAAEKHGGTAAQIGPAEWRLGLMNGRPFDATAAVDPAREWLSLDAMASSKPDASTLWRALTINGALGGHAKFALWRGALRLRAEVPLERADVLEASVSDTCGAFGRALALIDSHNGSAGEPARQDADGDGVQDTTGCVDLAAACREQGWNVIERSNGAAVVDLDCPGRFYQAVIEPRHRGRVSVTADLVQQPLGPTCRDAVAALLLTAARIVRFARPAVSEDGPRVIVRLEVVFDTAPVEPDVSHALAALSAACSIAGDEARALATEAIAKEYLAAIA